VSQSPNGRARPSEGIRLPRPGVSHTKRVHTNTVTRPAAPPPQPRGRERRPSPPLPSARPGPFAPALAPQSIEDFRFHDYVQRRWDSRHETARLRVRPVVVLASADPGQGPDWENADG
jgi:hypothetical protein